jgi:hypothetical protein
MAYLVKFLGKRLLIPRTQSKRYHLGHVDGPAAGWYYTAA